MPPRAGAVACAVARLAAFAFLVAGAAACKRALPVAYLRPDGLSVRWGERPGEVVLAFQPVEGATGYRIESAPSPEGPWTRVGEVPGTNVVLKMAEGVPYVFRVSAQGPKGRSQWSLMAGIAAPDYRDLWDKLHPPTPTPVPSPPAKKKRR